MNITSEAELEMALSEPTAAVVDTMRRLEGDILFLGVAGKMGPTMARMAKRASNVGGKKRRIIGVSRFSGAAAEQQLRSAGIETIRCDLLDEKAVERLPQVPNVVFMAGMKFGSTGQESLTWAMNTWLPAIVCKHFSKSRLVAFSTGNVYGLVPKSSGGSVETDTPNPAGEYAMSCLGRERIFEHFCRTTKIPVALIRLNYACELRYGVLVDIAQQIHAGRPVDLGMSWLNTVWQGDANAMSLQAFDCATSPATILNLSGPETLSVRQVAEKIAGRMGISVSFCGNETTTALLNNAQRTFQLFGLPRVTADELCDAVADWVKGGGSTLGKPTHFESRDGKF